MKIAITDANIFIDLIKLALLGCLFNLGIEIHTTKEVYTQLNPDQKIILDEFIEAGLLVVYNFGFEELQAINEVDYPSGLEFADRTVHFYSNKLDGDTVVLSGDQKLRKFYLSINIDVKEIGWLFDAFIHNRLITVGEAVKKMEYLLSYNDRFPISDCQLRMNHWKSLRLDPQ